MPSLPPSPRRSIEILLFAAVVATFSAVPRVAFGQATDHQHLQPPTGPATNWHVMQDGVAWLTYNSQGGPRGGDDFGSQNGWMGMLSRPTGPGATL